jgi:DNA-binding response OmpR family regulator
MEKVKPRILVVDDSLTVRMDLQEAFESAGFQVVLCQTAAEARIALAGQRFSLVVLDVILPDGDGVDLLGEIKSASVTATVPVMLLTTEVEVRDRVRGLKTGADDYVGKPYDRAHVVARARQLIGAADIARAQHAPTLLLIDDSATFREEFKTVLEAAGYSVRTAGTGEDGLSAAAAVRPQLIIVDRVLPGIDGATVIQRLRQDIAFRNTPCLLLTAADAPGDESRTLDAGADAYLRKDEDVHIILARIDALLRSGVTGSVVDPGARNLLAPKKVLAVDDSPTYLHVLAEELRSESYEVIAASSGREALQLLEVQAVDCILMDLRMPDLSGQETCQIIKKRPEWRNIPLVILTSVEESQAMVEGMNAGADDYIPKSTDFEVLRARVRAQLRRKQIEDEYRSIHSELLRKQVEAAEAKASQAIAEARAAMVDELERKNRELEAFTYSVSHDLRAPLRSINGFSRILKTEFGDQLDPKAHHYLNNVIRGSTRMSELIEALLELSRVSRAAFKRKSVDVSRLARAIAGELAQSDPERGVEFVVDEDLQADADPVLIRSVLENLLGNAWKFTHNVPTAKIQIGVLRQDNGLVYFVRDNGVGFDPAHGDKLFAPFQRLHAQSDFPGTGIGLATVQRIVDRHGGRVWAESAVGQGATFFFTLGTAGKGDRTVRGPAAGLDRSNRPRASRQDVDENIRPSNGGIH